MKPNFCNRAQVGRFRHGGGDRRLPRWGFYFFARQGMPCQGVSGGPARVSALQSRAAWGVLLASDVRERRQKTQVRPCRISMSETMRRRHGWCASGMAYIGLIADTFERTVAYLC